MAQFRPVTQALRAEVFLSPSASPSHGTRVTNHECGSIPQIEKLSHLAELLVAHLKQFTEGLIRQRRQLPVQHFIQEPRRPFVVGVRAALRLRNDLVHNPAAAPSLEDFARSLRPGRVLPHRSPDKPQAYRSA